jgi:crotonobetainyl-CoA:carnitine CoA-transferase CaiB-like acyl-CoA transferase
MTAQSMTDPLHGVRVVEVALATSDVGAGMATMVPGALLRDLGAEVVRVQSATRSTLDTGSEQARVWNRGKEVIDVDDETAAGVVRSLVADADVLFLCGDERRVERQGLGYQAQRRVNPRLVHVRVRPGVNALGAVPDLELLVTARAGVPGQIRSHVTGTPAFPDLPIAQAGAALSATVGALVRLYEREVTGVGGWAETSLYDGIQAMLPMILGRVEHHSPSTTLLWQQQGPSEGLAYPCADGGYLQLWFGAKGAYEAFLDAMGDEPSEQGYNADLTSGAMTERSARWAARLATKPRARWLEELAGRPFRCEPVLQPGEALLEPHVRSTGLSIEHDDPARGSITMLGPIQSVRPVGNVSDEPAAASGALLSDVRVLDLSAYLAGPIGTLVLAELGADVVKVEPVTGDVHRNMEPMYAAGQRGKRTVALDLKAPDAATVLERLFTWADVVHHNSRLGLAEKLGYDEATVRAVHPNVIYSFASGFGESGPRAPLPANDHLMQALSGSEAAQGGHGQPPTFLAWGALDVASGWLSAIAMLAGLWARRRTGSGQSASTSLLGAALLMKSGAFVAGDEVVGGPRLDAGQTGYGAAYRIYRCADDTWLALAVADAAGWTTLRALVGDDELPAEPPPLRIEGGEPQPAEAVLERAFLGRPAARWAETLAAAGVAAEVVPLVDRTAFTEGFVDDPVNAQLGRVVRHHWGERGGVDQPTFPPRVGPQPRPGAAARIAGLGEHTAEVLAALGFDEEARAELAASRTIAG